MGLTKEGGRLDVKGFYSVVREVYGCSITKHDDQQVD